MSDKMKIDVALTKLESGKFSFGMVAAIKDHVSGLENELEIARGRHDSLIQDLKLREIANWRLEAELTKLNTRIYALIRANILTEKAYEGMTLLATKAGEYLEVSRKYAAVALARLIADLKSGELQSRLVDFGAKIYAALKEIMPSKSALEELKPHAKKAGEYLMAFVKYVGVYVEKASAYLSTLHKTTA